MSPSLRTLIPNRDNQATATKPASRPVAKQAPKPAVKQAPKPSGPARENRLTRWYRETVSELKKVVWPSREEWTNLTAIVLVTMVAVGAFLSMVDLVFERVILVLVR